MKTNPSNSRDDRNGDSPHFQLDLLGAEGGGENGDSSHTPRIRVSRRARRMSVRVYPDARVEVVVPPRARAREVEQFLSAQRQWIDDKRAVALRNRPPPESYPPASLHFAATRESWRPGGVRGPSGSPSGKWRRPYPVSGR